MGFGDPVFKLGAGTTAAARPLAAAGQPGLVGANIVPAATRYDAEWGFRYAEVAPLPETLTELLALAAALGADSGTDPFVGAQATRRAVLDANLLDRRVVAFATHGLMPGELPGVSKPALAMAANVDERESPLLELDDVLGLRLNARWVLLSACNTAAGEQGGVAMSGLVRGFFFVGARSLALAARLAAQPRHHAAHRLFRVRRIGHGEKPLLNSEFRTLNFPPLLAVAAARARRDRSCPPPPATRYRHRCSLPRHAWRRSGLRLAGWSHPAGLGPACGVVMVFKLPK